MKEAEMTRSEENKTRKKEENKERILPLCANF